MSRVACSWECISWAHCSALELRWECVHRPFNAENQKESEDQNNRQNYFEQSPVKVGEAGLNQSSWTGVGIEPVSQYSGRTRTYSKLSRWDYNFFWQLKGTSGSFGGSTSGGKPKVIIHQDSPQVLWEKAPEEKFTKVVSRGRIISSSSAGDPETFCNSGTTGDSRPEQGTDQRTLTR